MARSAAWTRKEGQDPTGGLNARGRAAYKAATGGTLRPPVKAGDDPRRASFLARMGAVRGPMVRDGKPTRLALALRAWGASSKEDARKKARAISRRLREGNQMKKTRRNPAKRKNTRFFQAKMRTEPLSDYERHLAKQLRTIDPAKLEKMVPAWARSEKIKQFRFVPDAAPVYPAYASGTTISPEKRVFPEYIEGESTDEYARRFYEANKLRFKANPRKRKAKTTPSQTTGRAPSARLMRRRKKTVAGPRGFFANPRRTPSISGRKYKGFDLDSARYILTKHYDIGRDITVSETKKEIDNLLRKQKAGSLDDRGEHLATRILKNPVHTFKVLTRSKPSAPFALVGSFRDKSRAMQYARAIHKAAPTSLSVKVTN